MLRFFICSSLLLFTLNVSSQDKPPNPKEKHKTVISPDDWYIPELNGRDRFVRTDSDFEYATRYYGVEKLLRETISRVRFEDAKLEHVVSFLIKVSRDISEDGEALDISFDKKFTDKKSLWKRIQFRFVMF